MKKQCTLLMVGVWLAVSLSLGAQDKPVAATNAPVTDTNSVAPTKEVLELITFDEETPLMDVIKALARKANINYQLDPKLTAAPTPGAATGSTGIALAPVTLRFENVTAEQALLAVLDNYNLQLVRDPKTPIARITEKNPAALEPLVTKVFQLEYASTSNLVATLKPALGPRSQVLPDQRTGKMVIQATEKEMVDIEKLILELDSATRQVLIQAHIVETSRNPRSIRGLNWSGTLKAQNLAFGNNADATGTLQSPQVIAGRQPKGSFQFTPTAAFLNADGVRAVFSAFNEDSEAQLFAIPSTVVVDNQQTRLESTIAYPIFEVTPGSANVPASADISYTNLGTILLVTPRIASYSNISLKVVPEVSDLQPKDTQVLFGQAFSANVYAIRRMDTTVMVPSGTTLVLGGLVMDRATRTSTKVPVLGDLPGIGAAFRSKERSKAKSNLMIFITPTIIESTDFQETDTTYLQTPRSEPTEIDLPPLDRTETVPLNRYRSKF